MQLITQKRFYIYLYAYRISQIVFSLTVTKVLNKVQSFIQYKTAHYVDQWGSVQSFLHSYLTVYIWKNGQVYFEQKSMWWSQTAICCGEWKWEILIRSLIRILWLYWNWVSSLETLNCTMNVCITHWILLYVGIPHYYLTAEYMERVTLFMC